MLPTLVVIGESLGVLSHRLGTAQNRLHYLAYHDSLTGLHNRAYFYQMIEDLTARSARDQSLTLVLLVDLNGFKSVNDQFGHVTGDLLLCETAKVLEHSTMGHGLWARLGGDEFGCIVPSICGLEAAERFPGMVRNALETPIAVEDWRFRVGASIGIAVIPENGLTAREAIAYADAEVYFDKATLDAVDTHPVMSAAF